MMTRCGGVLWFAVVSALTALGCKGQAPDSVEPTAGAWKSILQSPSQRARSPAPPAADSEQEKSELHELLALQAKNPAQTAAVLDYWNRAASVRWNEIARDLVAKHRTSHPQASRVYALVSVAQYDASVAAWNDKYFYKRRAPSQASRQIVQASPSESEWVYPSAFAAVASASAEVLSYLFPEERAFLAEKAEQAGHSRLLSRSCFPSDVRAGDVLGRSIAEAVIHWGQKDGSEAPSEGALAAAPGGWFSSPNAEPLLPHWGSVTPFLMHSASELRSPPPPPVGSPAFKSALEEVRKISDTRTPEQARLAALWADGPGSYSPAGHWNKIAADLIIEHRLSEPRAARTFALMNMAMLDASIACWDTKYHYGVIRPSQADPAITTPVGLPNFPSYTSGHAAFSGAAGDVLGYVFPEEKQWLRDKAEEAAMSRIYGGIHYRFDSEAGLTQGRNVARLAVARGNADGAQ